MDDRKIEDIESVRNARQRQFRDAVGASKEVRRAIEEKQKRMNRDQSTQEPPKTTERYSGSKAARKRAQKATRNRKIRKGIVTVALTAIVAVSSIAGYNHYQKVPNEPTRFVQELPGSFEQMLEQKGISEDTYQRIVDMEEKLNLYKENEITLQQLTDGNLGVFVDECIDLSNTVMQEKIAKRNGLESGNNISIQYDGGGSAPPVFVAFTPWENGIRPVLDVPSKVEKVYQRQQRLEKLKQEYLNGDIKGDSVMSALNKTFYYTQELALTEVETKKDLDKGER